MNILFWVDKFPTFSETFIRDQIICLLNQNLNIYIHTNNGKVNTQEVKSLSGFENYKLIEKVVDINAHFQVDRYIRTIQTIKIICINLFSKNLKYYLKSIKAKEFGEEAKSLRLFFKVHFILKNNINVIHAHFGPNGNNATVFKKIGLPIKLFTTFHGYDIRLGLKKGTELYCDLFKYSDGIFSISDYNFKSLLKLGAPNKIIFPLLNGIDVDFYRQVAPVSKPEILKIITVARLVEEKALHIAIQAISEVLKIVPELNFEYTIVGEGDQRVKLQELINSLGLTKNIKLIGAKNSIEVRDLLTGSDLFLLSSISEALPTVLLEAQASGLVVLATNVGSVADIVKGGFTVAPLDVNQFTKGLTQLINAKQNWNELAKVGREYVCNHHDIKKQTKKLIAFYNLKP